MIVHPKKEILRKTGSQDLSSSAMSVTTAFGKDWQLAGVYVHFTAACNQDISVTRDSTTGSNYDAVIKTETLSSAEDFAFRPTGNELYAAGDEVTVAITKGGTATAYLEIIGFEI